MPKQKKRKKRIGTKKKGAVKFSSSKPEEQLNTVIFGDYIPSKAALDFVSKWYSKGYPYWPETHSDALKERDVYAAQILVKAINDFKNRADFFKDLGIIFDRMFKNPVDLLRVQLIGRVQFQKILNEPPETLQTLLKHFPTFSERTIRRAAKDVGLEIAKGDVGRPKNSDK